MNSLLIAMLCIAVIVIGALAALVVILLKPGKDQTRDSARTTGRPRAAWQSWIPFFAIAFLLILWSIWIALLFLVVAWIMRMSPRPDSNYTLDKDQKNTAKRVYTWLFWSSMITVPFFIVMLSFADWGSSSTNGNVLPALVPLIVHLPLLAGFASKSAFVYRHTQQGILLLAFRATMASLAVSMGGIVLFLLGNGTLWLFGSIWGWNQITRNECWLMKRKGETVLTLEEQPLYQLVKNGEFEELLKSLNAEGNTARQKALNAFRTGTPEIRKKAVLALSQLGEVEKF